VKKMEMILALAVVIAVIVFGGLISVGNERQRKAIDGIREQAVLWALQDLRLKREKLARDVKVDDPVKWLNALMAKICGEFLDLNVTEVFDAPQTLVCTDKNARRVLLSLASPGDIRRMKRERKNKLLCMSNGHPLLDLPQKVEQVEISILNGGIFFDLELPAAWEMLSGREIIGVDKVWVYA
jgi:hypothetical protein